MEEAVIIKDEGEKRSVMIAGSFVYFFENDHQQFCNNSRQGFIEEIDSPSQEVTIRTVEGKILRNVSIHRVFL